jgi:uncharacterized protein (DUF2164 family)
MAISSLQNYFEENLDGRIGNLEANALLSFVLEEIGPCLYNKGVLDAQERMQMRLGELDYEVHEEEFPISRRVSRQPKGRR